jgi:hypothetical protein
MDRKLDSLLAGQERIFRAQEETYKALVEVSKQIQTNHEMVMLELRRIHGEVLINRQLILSQVNSAYQDCRVHVFALRRDENGNQVEVRVIDTGKGIYPSLLEISELRRDNPGAFGRCSQRLRLIRDGNSEFNATFFLNSHKTEGGANQIDNYLENVYAKALGILRKDLPFDLSDGNETKRITAPLKSEISSLLSPMEDVDSLNRKLMAGLPDVTQARFVLPLERFMANPLSSEAVSVHAEHVLDIHFYYPMLKGDDFIVSTRDELLKAATISRAGESLLTETLNLVDIAIAQETLVSGDYMLPVLKEILKTPDGAPGNNRQAISAEAITLLNNDSVLAQNFILYCVTQGLRDRRSNILTYAAGLASLGNPSILNSVTGVPSGVFERNTTEEKRDLDGDGEEEVTKPVGWYVRLGDKSYLLPSAKAVQEGKFSYTPELIRLLQLRSRLTDELSAYSAFDGISIATRQRFNKLLLNSL